MGFLLGRDLFPAIVRAIFLSWLKEAVSADDIMQVCCYILLCRETATTNCISWKPIQGVPF